MEIPKAINSLEFSSCLNAQRWRLIRRLFSCVFMVFIIAFYLLIFSLNFPEDLKVTTFLGASIIESSVEGLGDKNAEEMDVKFIALLPDDVKLLKAEIKRAEKKYGKSHPELYFFRHLEGRGGNSPNTRFGRNYLYNKWVKACKKLGVKVTLYGGTRHSTQVAMRQKGYGAKDIKRAAMTKTDEAHMRYLQLTGKEVRMLYTEAKPDNTLIMFSGVSENLKPLKTIDKSGARGET